MVINFSMFKSEGDKRVHTAIAEALPKHFVANLRVIVDGRRGHSESLSKNTESRKHATVRRCERLREKDFGHLIRWSIAYPPTAWEGRRKMRDDVFLRLLEASEPEAELQSARFFQVVLRELETTGLNTPGCIDKIVTGQLPESNVSRKNLTSPALDQLESFGTDHSPPAGSHTRIWAEVRGKVNTRPTLQFSK
jgi:hypothetical protein